MPFIVPEVYADLAQAEFINKAKVFNSGAVVSDDTLAGQPGETIHFPKWDLIGDELDTLTKGTPMVPASMGQTDRTATIVEAGKAVEFDDTDELTGLGDPQSEAVRQFGLMAARKLDSDLIAAATAAGSLTAAGQATETAGSWKLVTRGIEAFGDDFEPEEFAGLFVNSTEYAAFLRDPQFIDASKVGDSSVVRRGQIGLIGGLAVFTTNRVPAGKLVIVKQNALGALYKRRPLVETDRDILKRSTVVTTNVHYAVKRLNDKGVCVVTPSAT